VVRLGDTAVVCGIRGEILLAKDIPNAPVVTNLPDPSQSQDEDMDENEEEEDDAQEIADLNLLVPNIELSTGCSPAHLPGSPPSTLAQSLSQRLLSHLHSTRLLRASDLRILYRPPPPPDTGEDEVPEVEIKAYWTLYIDILVISLDGNIFDAAWFSILAALLDTTLPKAYYDADREAILCTHDARKLRLRGLPVPSTFAVFDSSTHKGVDLSTEKEKKKTSYILADPDTLEESLCKETLTIMVDYDAGGDAKIKGIEKVGGGVIGREEMKECTRLAVGRWAEWNGILMD
jgi:exosome complex component RRP43